MTIMQKQAGLVEADAVDTIPNGPGAAAILAAGIGSGALGILALAGDASETIGKWLNFYNPTGTLSGVSTLAILAWLISWFALNRAWKTQTVSMVKVSMASFALLAVGLLLTCPPVMDLLQGK
jgi:hypothetical protein